MLALVVCLKNRVREARPQSTPTLHPYPLHFLSPRWPASNGSKLTESPPIKDGVSMYHPQSHAERLAAQIRKRIDGERSGWGPRLESSFWTLSQWIQCLGKFSSARQNGNLSRKRGRC